MRGFVGSADNDRDGEHQIPTQGGSLGRLRRGESTKIMIFGAATHNLSADDYEIMVKYEYETVSMT